MPYTNLRDFYNQQYASEIARSPQDYNVDRTLADPGQRTSIVRQALGTLEDNKVYSLGSLSGLEGYQNQFLKQGNQFIPILGDASKYGPVTALDFGPQELMQVGAGVRPLDMAIKSGQDLAKSNEVYGAALNDSTTPRLIDGKVVSGAEALAQQNAAREAYNAKTNEKVLPQSTYGTASSQQNTTATQKILNTTNIPFATTMVEKQKTGIQNMLQTRANEGSFLSANDQGNLAYALGQKNTGQFANKTPEQIINELSQPASNIAPAGGSSYIVKKGDTLSAIATKFGTTVAALLSANPDIKNANLIYQNQKVIVPEINKQTDPNKQVNDFQKEIKDAAPSGEKSSTAGFFKEAEKPEEKQIVDFKIPSQLEKYQAIFGKVDAGTLAEDRKQLADLNAQLKDLDLQESKLEADIRKEVEGEAPTSLIRALVAEKAKALYPKKQEIANKIEAVQTRLNNDLENAKAEFQLSVADQENGMKYLQTLISNGVKLTSEQMALADQALGFGKGFTKLLSDTQTKALTAAKEKEQLELMSKIIDMQMKLPEGKSFEIGGATYTSMTDPNKDIQIFKEEKGGKVVIIEYNKRTRKVVVTQTGVTSTSQGGGAKSEYFTRPKADGTIGYYFGDPKNVAGAQELKASEYLKGTSKAEGVLDTVDIKDVEKQIDILLEDGKTVSEIEDKLKSFRAEFADDEYKFLLDHLRARGKERDDATFFKVGDYVGPG